MNFSRNLCKFVLPACNVMEVIAALPQALKTPEVYSCSQSSLSRKAVSLLLHSQTSI